MYKHLIFKVLILLLVNFNCLSQIHIKGVVLKEKDKTPIPYAAIGILNTTVGTISELDGTFQITVPRNLIRNDLLCSALGFERTNISLTDINNAGTEVTILLKEKIIVLEEVTVKSNNRLRRFEFGNREFDGGSMYAHTEAAGSAMVMLVDNGFPHYSGFKFPALLEKIFLRIVNNTFSEFKLRLRLYAFDSISGLPGKDLLDKDIFVHDKIRNGWLELKLSEHNIILNGPFFLGFEWILDVKGRGFLHKQYSEWYRKHPQLVTRDSIKIGAESVQYSNYNGTLWPGTSFGSSATSENAPKYKCYYRFNSFGKWYVSPTALCMKIMVLI